MQKSTKEFNLTLLLKVLSFPLPTGGYTPLGAVSFGSRQNEKRLVRIILTAICLGVVSPWNGLTA